MEGIEITVLNLSKLEWRRNNWGVGAGSSEKVNWTDEVTQTPSEVLKAHNYATTAAASSVHLSGVVKDALFVRLGYGSTEGSFAVLAQQLFHLFGIGPQAQWMHWDKEWSNGTPDTTPYTWHFSSCKVVATPTLSDTSASIAIVISNL